MGTTAEKLTYLNTTKQNLKTVINTTGAGLTDESTFRSYANVLNDKILGAINGDVDLFEEYPKVSGNGTDLSLNGVVEGKMSITPQGSSSQDGEPTPTTPIPVKSVTGENSLIISNENLIDFQNNSLIQRTINTNGVVEANSNCACSNNLTPVLTNSPYTLSSQVSMALRICEYDKNKVFIKRTQKEGTIYSIITSENTKYIGYSIYLGSSNMTQEKLNSYKLMFTKGSTAPSTYVEHEEQNYQLSLGNIELNSSPDGTIRDGIIGSPNNWYKREYIGKVVLDGSENWVNDGGNAPYRISIDGSLITTDNNTLPNVLINRFKTASYNSSWSAYSSLAVPDEKYYSTRLKFRYTAITSLADWKSWLSENNVTVYYLKSQYTDIPITDTTLINQLNDIYNNAHSYNGVTNITTTYEDGNEQMYLDAEVLKNVWDTSL